MRGDERKLLHALAVSLIHPPTGHDRTLTGCIYSEIFPQIHKIRHIILAVPSPTYRGATMSSALGMHQLIPSVLLEGKWLVVFSFYIDDSGTDPQNPLITLAGYVARDEAWRAFEANVEPIFARHRVKILHAMEMHNTDGEFDGWRVLKKEAFVAELYRSLSRYIPLGMHYSAVKKNYKKRVPHNQKTIFPTSYAWCFNVLIDRLLKRVDLGRSVHENGVAFVVESGNVHNGEIEKAFHGIRKSHNLENVLRSISFVEKSHSRAIQMADLLAFYARRYSTKLNDQPKIKQRSVRREQILKIMLEKIPHDGGWADDFGNYDNPDDLSRLAALRRPQS